MPYHHELRIRYGECDMQHVVFNANYAAYIDDATDTWFRTAGVAEFDVMVKRLSVEWHSAARFGEILELEAEVSRWGTTSFDVRLHGHVGDRAVLDATVVYVSTIHGSNVPTPIPDAVRSALARPPGS